MFANGAVCFNFQLLDSDGNWTNFTTDPLYQLDAQTLEGQQSENDDECEAWQLIPPATGWTTAAQTPAGSGPIF